MSYWIDDGSGDRIFLKVRRMVLFSTKTAVMVAHLFSALSLWYLCGEKGDSEGASLFHLLASGSHVECHATLGSCEQEPGRAHGLCAEESVGVTTVVRQTALGMRARRCRFPAGPLSPFSTFTCFASFRLFACFLSVSRVFCVGSLEKWDSLKRE